MAVNEKMTGDMRMAQVNVCYFVVIYIKFDNLDVRHCNSQIVNIISNWGQKQMGLWFRGVILS